MRFRPLSALALALAACATLGVPDLRAERPKAGYMDWQGKVVIPPRYYSGTPFSEGRAMVWEKSNRLIDSAGRELRAGIDDARKFTGGRVAVKLKEGRGWGYLDRDGRLVIPDTLKAAHDFSEGLAAAATGTGYGFIDTAGNWVIPPQYKDAGPFSGGRAQVVGAKPPAMFIDRTGRVVIPGAGTKVERPFQDGFACVKNDFMKTWYFIDTAGNALPHPKLERCNDFSGGFASVTFKDTAGVGGKYGIIDRQGKVVFATDKYLSAYSEGLVTMTLRTDACQFIDAAGTPRITRTEDSLPLVNCGIFHKGVAVVQPQRKDFALIDTAGRYVLPPLFSQLDPKGELITFKPGDGVDVLNSEKTGTIDSLLTARGIKTGVPGAGGQGGTGEKGKDARWVAWKLVRAGTLGGGPATRVLEYVEVTSSTEPSLTQVEKAARWRPRMGWIQENVGVASLAGGKDAKLEALRGAFGPGYNNVKNVQGRSMGAVKL